jgi:haloacetate dehalogenase
MRSVCTVAARFNGRRFASSTANSWLGCTWIQKQGKTICEEYRAAATLDHAHDLEDRRAGRRIACPVLVLWSDRGPLGTWYAEDGGPLALWRAWANDVRGSPLNAGHFFPEEIPERTAKELSGFFATAS